ncbi:MAG: acetyl-CoA carboxylase, carboxyltransferase subunit beta [Defluviicoccus sp.]|nr:acetyl-CoA carboxylase, carboxyltransferase subunit beta [Defluviicoccus sp.]
MNWLNNIRPKIRALVGKRQEVPEHLWAKCPQCEQMIFHRELEAALHVCSHCGHHLRIDARTRIDSILDGDGWETVELAPCVADPLKFRDRKRYSERLRDSRSQTGGDDAILVAAGTLKGAPAVIAAFYSRFWGGCLVWGVAKATRAAAPRAVADEAALIVFPSSGGARMQEGILSLVQMPRTAIAIERVKQAGLPYIVVLTDPTTGGVSASFAMLGDIAIAEPGATIGFAGRRVIEETIRETLPENFQSAEYLLEHGMVDMVVPRAEMRDTLADLIDLLTNPLETPDPEAELELPPPPAEPTPDAAVAE